MAISSEPLVSPETLGVDAERSAVWRRLMAPSLSDFLFVSLLVWMFAAGSAGWLGLLVDGDTGWHIRTGEYILANHRVPTRDLFSFSKADQPWFAWEWVSDVGLALLYRAARFKGVTLAAGVIIALSALLVFRRMMWRGANLFVALGVALLGVGASSVHFLARPHVTTLLLMSAGMWILDRDRRSPTRAVWLLIPLTALWTNLHGGFLAMVACLALLAAGCAIEAWLGAGDWRAVRRYALLAAGCAAATLVNPYGYHLHQHVLSYLRSDWIRKVVQEFQSPAFRSENMLQFEVLMLVGLGTAARLLERRRVVEALWIVFWVHASLGSVRHVPVFVVVAAPLIASEASLWWEKWTEGRSSKSILGIFASLGRDLAGSFRRTSVWAPLAVLALVLVNEPMKWPRDFPETRFPVKAAERYGVLLSGSRVFTSDQWADYLTYRFYPRYKAFFDGRSDFYGPAIGEQYINLVQGRWDWEQILEKHRFDVVLSPAEWPLASLLKRHPGWRVEADDGRGVLFVRGGRAGEKRPGGTNEKD